MTAMTDRLGFIAFETEDSFADAADDTYTSRIQVRDDTIDMSGLARPMMARGGARQYLNAGDFDVPGAYGVGTFSFSMDLYGHGTTTADALTTTALAQLLAHALGGLDAGNNGGVESGVGSTTTSLVTDGGSEDFADGSILRVGAHGDARGGGQAAVVASTTGTPNTAITLATAIAAAGNDGDVVYAMLMAYPISSVASAALTSSAAAFNNTLRFVLATANLQYVAKGCACTGIEISGLDAGETPSIRFTFSAAFWDAVSQTFPSATATADYAPAPVANGSVFIQAAGTTTRATYDARAVAISLGIGMQPVFGPGGANIGQNVIGWRRIPAPTTVSLSVPAEAVTATPVWWDYYSTNPNTIAAKHMLWLSAPVDGRAVSFYCPRLKPVGTIPTQASIDGLTYVPLTFEALTDESASTELERSNIRFGLG